MRYAAAFVGAMALAALGGSSGGWRAADPPAKDGGKGFPDLVAALKDSPGCLGVETAQTASGKAVIFAWFEDKKAALKWYNSDTHQEIMKRFLPDYKSGRKPLADVPDDSGPTKPERPSLQDLYREIDRLRRELEKSERARERLKRENEQLKKELPVSS